MGIDYLFIKLLNNIIESDKAGQKQKSNCSEKKLLQKIVPNRLELNDLMNIG